MDLSAFSEWTRTLLEMDRITLIWLVVGLLGQFLFSMRFIVQWIISEKRHESVVPVIFWYFSLLGGACLLTYAISRRDPVFTLGQSAGLVVYLRNLILIYQKRSTPPAAPTAMA